MKSMQRPEVVEWVETEEEVEARIEESVAEVGVERVESEEEVEAAVKKCVAVMVNEVVWNGFDEIRQRLLDDVNMDAMFQPESRSPFGGDSEAPGSGCNNPVSGSDVNLLTGGLDSGECNKMVDTQVSFSDSVVLGRVMSDQEELGSQLSDEDDCLPRDWFGVDLPMADANTEFLSLQESERDDPETLPALFVARSFVERESGSEADQDDRQEADVRAMEGAGVDSGSDADDEGPRVLQYKPDRRRRKTCQLCGDEVVRMTEHLKSLKHQNIPNAMKPRLAEYMNMRGGMKDTSGKLKKVCPYQDCGKFANDMTAHLKKKPHNLPTDIAATMSKTAIPVKRFDWAGLIQRYTLLNLPVEAVGPVVLPPDQASIDLTSNDQGESRQESAADNIVSRKVPLVGNLSASNTVLLAEYKAFLMYNPFRPESGETNKAKEIYKVNEQVSAVEKFMKFHSLLPLEELFLKDNLQTYLSEKQKLNAKAGTLDSILTRLSKFVNFLEEKGKIDFSLSTRFSRGIATTRGNLKELKAKRRNEVRDSSSETLIDPAARVEFTHSTYNKDAIDELVQLVDYAAVTTDQLRQYRRVLLLSLCLYTGARTSVFEGMTQKEIFAAKPQCTKSKEIMYVIRVVNHKTFMHGSFTVPVSARVYKALCNFQFLMRHTYKLSQPNEAFLTDKGKGMSSSRISYELSLAWKAAGITRDFGKFNATINRKSLTTHGQKADPLLTRPLATQLKHSQSTSDRYYRANIEDEEAANTCEWLQEAVEGSSLSAKMALQTHKVGVKELPSGKNSSGATATATSPDEVDEEHLDLGRYQFPVLDDMTKDQFLNHIQEINMEPISIMDAVIPFLVKGGDDMFRTKTCYIQLSEALVSRVSTRFDIDLTKLICERFSTKNYNLPDKATYMIVAVQTYTIGATLGSTQDPEQVIARDNGPSMSQVMSAMSEEPYPTVNPDWHMSEILAEQNKIDKNEEHEKQLKVAQAEAEKNRLLAAAEATLSADLSYKNGTEKQRPVKKRPATAAAKSGVPLKRFRREWTEREWLSFRIDFSLEIETTKASGKKTPISDIRSRLSVLGDKWKHLEVYQVRDKIWTEATGKGKAAKKFGKEDLV